MYNGHEQNVNRVAGVGMSVSQPTFALAPMITLVFARKPKSRELQMVCLLRLCVKPYARVWYRNIRSTKMPDVHERRFFMQHQSVLRLYRDLLREAAKFHSYNYRTYALQRIKSGFREQRAERELDVAEKLLREARDSLEMLKRQTFINRSYAGERLVIESQSKKH